MDLKSNSIINGIIIGLVLPFLGFWFWKGLFSLLTMAEIMDPTGFSDDWRQRTCALLAICMNILPFRYSQNKRHDETMRGLIFPTITYVIIWVVVFRGAIFGQF